MNTCKIEVKGFNKKQKKWVYGYLVKINNKCYVVDKNCKYKKDIVKNMIKVDCNKIRVYTGLKDKNEEEIYTGDRIIFTDLKGTSEMFNTSAEVAFIYGSPKAFIALALEWIDFKDYRVELAFENKELLEQEK